METSASNNSFLIEMEPFCVSLLSMKLFINSSTRSASRTRELAEAYIAAHPGDWKTLSLRELNLQPLNEERLAKRMELLAKNQLDDPLFDLAREFASAEEILIAAPHYDLSFPSLLKLYIENIYIIGIVSLYSEDGRPQGLCKAKQLTYVATSGGPFEKKFGYEYIEELCKTAFNIQNCRLIYAENLDIEGYDAEEILAKAKESL